MLQLLIIDPQFPSDQEYVPQWHQRIRSADESMICPYSTTNDKQLCVCSAAMLVSILLYLRLTCMHLIIIYNLPQVWSAAANEIMIAYHKSQRDNDNNNNDDDDEDDNDVTNTK
jgi:N6-adenosine-specific RNA methylase IME4